MTSSDQDGPNSSSISRRNLLKAGAAGAGGLALTSAAAQLIEKAAGASVSKSASINDIEHVVILMQENRSFDHYYGTMSGVRGFDELNHHRSFWNGPISQGPGIFRQLGYRPGAGVDPSGYLEPFHLLMKPPTVDGQSTNDITHDWGPQHHSWNNGAMDKFLAAHLASDGTARLLGSTTEVPNGVLTMGYFERSDIPFYYALADAFTICDNYFCSVLGPTDPNRLMMMSGSIGADGNGGLPVLETYVQTRPEHFGTLDWKTMPEALSEAGVSWKVYQDPSSYTLFNVLPYFKNFIEPKSAGAAEIAALGTAPVYPAEFAADVAADTLPSVSWILPLLPCCEHPATPPAYGEFLVSEILSILTSNPDVWAKTLFILDYDENGGFFDHVSPPTPGPVVTSLKEVPSGDEFIGEYVTADVSASDLPSDYFGVLGPVGLGFRVPCMLISPFTTGGYVSQELLDHTSVLQFIAKRFGAEVPNVSTWRRNRVGDLTKSIAHISTPDLTVPKLPATSLLYPEIAEQVLLNSLTGTVDDGVAYPPPTSNSMPVQATTPARTVIGR